MPGRKPAPVEMPKNDPDIEFIFDKKEDEVEVTTVDPTGGPKEPVVNKPVGTSAPLSYDKRITSENVTHSIAGSGSANFAHFLRLKENGKKVEIRFMDDFTEGLRVARHSDFNSKINPTTCNNLYGNECELCNQGVPLKDWYAWNVWNFDEKKPQILAVKASRGGVVEQLHAFWQQNGSITRNNFVYERKEEKNSDRSITRYLMTPRIHDEEMEKRIKTKMKEVSDQRYDLDESLRPGQAPGKQEESETEPISLELD